MQKTEAYHEAAIKYNEGLAEKAEELAPTLGHEEVMKWCTAVGKQHRFHAKRHRSALNKLQTKQEPDSVESVTDGLDVPEPAESEPQSENHDDVPQEVDSGPMDAFEDGCVGEHKPLENENCAYSPNNMSGTSGGNG